MEKTLIIEIFSSGHAKPEHYVVKDPVVKIGRGYQNDCVIMDPFVDAQHCFLKVEGGEWILKDNHSENGIYSRKQKKEVKEVSLISGDEVVIGRTRLRFISSEHKVEPARALAQRKKSYRRMNSVVNMWSLIIVMLMFYATSFYLESYVVLTVKKIAAMAIWQFVCVLIWASVWSFVGRVIKHRAMFPAHVSVTALFWIFIILLDYITDIIGYNFNHFFIHWGSFAVGGGILFTILLTRNLSLATNLSRFRQIMVSVTICVLMGSVGSLSYVAFRDEFNPNPGYYAELYPPFAKIGKSQTVDDFVEDSETIFSLANKNAQQIF